MTAGVATARSRIAFVGLGTMGSRMARHLVDAGHEVIACDLDPARARALGAHVAKTPAEAAAQADAMITSLPSPEAVEEVVLGPGGLRAGARAGSTVIEMSTSPPALERRLAAELESAGIDFLDAPVSGGPVGAEAATLAIMVGGRAEVFARNRAILELLGRLVVHVGDVGAGQILKLCNNLIVAAEMVAIAEGCAILERSGLDPSLAYDVLTSSTSDSRVMRLWFPIPGVKAEHPATRDYEPMFTLELLHKDLELALELATEVGVEAQVASQALRLYKAALRSGLGHLDFSAVYRAVRE